jgi:HSP20 family molecular chaperone IbpA
MGFRDLVPWTKSQQLSTAHDAFDPFFTLHREMNRLFGDVFRGFGPLSRVVSPLMEGRFGWPRLELSDTDNAVTVSAELPGLSEKDVQVEIANGVLSIHGEKKAERSDESKFVTLLRIVRTSDSAGGRRRRQGQGGFQERRPDCDASEIRAVEPERQNVLRGGGVSPPPPSPSLALSRLSRKEQKETRHEPGRSHRQQCWALFPPCIPLRFTRRCLE